jgi:hypothetical protein
MSDIKDQTLPNEASGEPVQFHYIKSNSFRMVHVDGAIGSITPTGYIHAAVYSERMPIPRMAAHSVGKDGVLGPAIEQDMRTGVVREVEIGLLFSRGSAEALKNWLAGQIEALDKAVLEARAAAGGTVNE